MRRIVGAVHLAWFVVLVGAGWSSSVSAGTSTTPSTLQPFSDEAELQSFVAGVKANAEKQRQAAEAERRAYVKAHPEADVGTIAGTTLPGANVVVENAATGYRRELTADSNGYYRVGAVPSGEYTVSAVGQSRKVVVASGFLASSSLYSVEVIGGGVTVPAPRVTEADALETGDGITNVQTAGIDEGGIVKKSGDFLVVLRRGRLFSIRATDRELRLVSVTNAFGSDRSMADAWYDEMLISGSTVVVIGYSYQRGGTEVGLFHLSDRGVISYRATYQLFSNDYYSSRNYASRLVGNTLIFYSPTDLISWSSDKVGFPSIRRWNRAEPGAPFKRIAPAENIYRSGIAEDSIDQTLHSITRCELAANAMDCRSTSVLGPSGSAFYVSREAVYVWMVDDRSDRSGREGDGADASVLRMPLDDSPPTALRVQGSPIDQMSFLEKDGYLNVIVGADAKGLRMWSAEGDSGGLALLRVPLAEFGDATAAASPKYFHALPSGRGEDGFWDLQNRFVGSWLVYGGASDSSSAYAVQLEHPDSVLPLHTGHAAERIEAMGENAMIIGGAGGDLRMTSVALNGTATLKSQYVLSATLQTDDRTQAYFYRPLDAGGSEGLLGLPVVDVERGRAAIEFVRNDRLRLHGVGSLVAATRSAPSDKADGCIASCVDWYGNSRPIFIGSRMYALLGYELVEGDLYGGRVREIRRLDFQPKQPK